MMSQLNVHTHVQHKLMRGNIRFLSFESASKYLSTLQLRDTACKSIKSREVASSRSASAVTSGHADAVLLHLGR